MARAVHQPHSGGSDAVAAMLGTPAAAPALVALKHGLGCAGAFDHRPDRGLHLPAGGGFVLVGAAVFAIQNDHLYPHKQRDSADAEIDVESQVERG